MYEHERELHLIAIRECAEQSRRVAEYEEDWK